MHPYESARRSQTLYYFLMKQTETYKSFTSSWMNLTGYPPSQGYSSRTEEYLDDDDEDRPCTCDEEGVYDEGDFSQNLPCDCDDVTGVTNKHWKRNIFSKKILAKN